MRPLFIVVSSVFAGFFAHFCQVLPVVLVQALVAELAVKTLDVGVLRGLPRLDAVLGHAVLLGPVLYNFACVIPTVTEIIAT